ncbi:DinB family protein [Bradyrhizobium sp. HKCCYLR20261]|uniref:DinB family protein n=1 Tax=Bradyrhizobium sp. HKCCYLR20261 TaxID=3420760 RepID=UPI003EB76DC0
MAARHSALDNRDETTFVRSTYRGDVQIADCPYRTLMHYKRWATLDLYAVLSDTLRSMAEPDQGLVLRLLDHVQAVDEIFIHHLERRTHGYSAARSAKLPSFEILERTARSSAEWYVTFADHLSPQDRDEPIMFSFTNGEPMTMTPGQMLLHVAAHGCYHRGNVGLLLQKNGIAPNQDRLTDFLVLELQNRL